MIKDAKGRRWFMRFKRYRNGWHWEARHGDVSRQVGPFRTKSLAEADARSVIPGRDAIAEFQEYWRRLLKRGSACRLTADDRKAIERAAEVVS